MQHHPDQVVYEVTIEIDAAIRERYEDWLCQHIQQMLVLPGFEHAQWFMQVDEQSMNEVLSYTVHYWVRDQDALQSYFAVHAPKLRGDADKHFKNQYRIRRRILMPRHIKVMAPV